MVRLFARFTAVVAVALALAAGGLRAAEATTAVGTKIRPGPCGGDYPCLTLNDLHCYELDDKCQLPFRFEGVVARPLTVHFVTENGTAVAGEDFEPVRDAVVEVPVGTERGEFALAIRRDRETERDEYFYVLAYVTADEVVVGEAVAEVTIVDAQAGR